jgi:hypothetical protein
MAGHHRTHIARWLPLLVTYCHFEAIAQQNGMVGELQQPMPQLSIKPRQYQPALPKLSLLNGCFALAETML